MNKKNSCKVCRSVSKKLYLKGDRCYSEKCAITRMKSIPGKKNKERFINHKLYKQQLIQKRIVTNMYGITLLELKKYFTEFRSDTNKYEDLYELLESRIDNVLFRIGISSSREHAKQLINHGQIQLNDYIIDSPSLRVNVGDRIIFPSMYKEKNTTGMRIEKNTVIVDEMLKLSEKERLFDSKLLMEFLSR